MKKIVIVPVLITAFILSACTSAGTAETTTEALSTDASSIAATKDEDLVMIGSKGIKTEYYNALFEIEDGVLYVSLNNGDKKFKTQIEGADQLMVSPMTAEGYHIYASLTLYDKDGSITEVINLGAKDSYFTQAEIESALGELTEVV